MTEVYGPTTSMRIEEELPELREEVVSMRIEEEPPELLGKTVSMRIEGLRRLQICGRLDLI